MKACRYALAALAALSLTSTAHADGPWPTLNHYGEPGILQTPSARFEPEGAFTLGVSASHPYNRIFLTHQPLSWLSATFRYTEIANRLYSPDPNFSGDQSYKDRGFDVRVRLLKEGEYWPALVLGLRDLSGTSLFGAEYLVASRRYYDFDFSLGLGWGRLGSGGELKNPFRSDTPRESSSGEVNAASLFAGERIGVLGALTWRSPIKGLMLQVERDANDYRSEPFDNRQKIQSPVNLGLVYRPRSWFEAGLAWERGDTLSGRIAFLTNFATEKGLLKFQDPPLLRLPPPATDESTAPTPAQQDEFAQALQKSLEHQKIPVQAAGISQDVATAVVESGPYREPEAVIERTARALAATAPASTEAFRVRQLDHGLPQYEATVQRAEIERTAPYGLPIADALGPQAVSAAPADPIHDIAVRNLRRYPDFDWGMGPAIRQHIGGPDGFYFGQLWWRFSADLDLAPRLNLSSAIGVNVYNNFDGLTLQSDSELPHVRSDIVQYLKEGETNLVRLEANYVQALAPDLYGRLSAGLFEEMYGGIAGEVLYRPFYSRWAVGVNVNRVRQRDFDQRFTFRDYEVTTGHLTTYYQWPQPSLLFKFSVGQYLAGDRGGTLDVSRRYRNGFRVGLFATKTNVAASSFGEGSFDKGFYIHIPFDMFLPRSSRLEGSLAFRPLTRDGGQMVRDGRPLFTSTTNHNEVIP